MFQATATQSIDSIGVFHDLTATTLTYELSQVTTATGNIGVGKTILATGTTVANTAGLEWIDIPIASTPLVAGNIYHIRFSFVGNANQNFFYNNANVTFSQAGFNLIDGTSAENTGNTVMPAVRLNIVAATPVPTLSEWGIIFLILTLLTFSFFKTRRSY